MLQFVIALLLLLPVSEAHSRTLEIGPGKEFANLNAAAASAQPGDTIMFATGVHAGGAHVTDLQGTAERWITIRGDGSMTAIIRGGSNAFQLTDAAYLKIEGLVFEAQTGNGVNMDDGGTYDTPSHNIVISNCQWRNIAASGNNDLLKMSGIDSFAITECLFTNGADAGSMIDMVGCHSGVISDSYFQNAGSNCIQTKGGTSEIVIERNRFLQGGQRAINIGGSTGLEFFRPLGVTYEARGVKVWSNIFEGNVAPIAYVGAVDCHVSNNTIVEVERWAIRILQESVDGFQPCGNNSFINNIVVTRSIQPAINIGGNTAPETFTFSNNLWYHPDYESWNGPNTPVSEPGRILKQDPQFEPGYRLASSSPAVSSGLTIDEPQLDFYGIPFGNPRSIGAVSAVRAEVSEVTSAPRVRVYPNPASTHMTISGVDVPRLCKVIDVLGRVRWSATIQGEHLLDVSQWLTGVYTLSVDSTELTIIKQ